MSNNIILAFVNAFLDIVNRAVGSLSDPWNAGIILQVLAIGGARSRGSSQEWSLTHQPNFKCQAKARKVTFPGT